jgi:hypothetical protein
MARVDACVGNIHHASMRTRWEITEADIETVKLLLSNSKSVSLVKERQARNVDVPGEIPKFSRHEIWRVMVGCLLTTQQKSGPSSSVHRFLHKRPFPLSLTSCLQEKNVARFAKRQLSEFGGIRRTEVISSQLAGALQKLEEGEWSRLQQWFATLRANRSVPAHHDQAVTEREAALYISNTFVGFGPKQSRNFWQWLGLSRFEIPLDSRIAAWLNDNLCSDSIAARALSDSVYYEMVLSGIHELCARANIIPCMFDAAVFSSFDATDVAEAEAA